MMVNEESKDLQQWLQEIANLIEKDADPDPQMVSHFMDTPQLAFQLITFLDTLTEQAAQDGHPLFSACIFALDICVNQLHSMNEYGNKIASKTLAKLMDHMAKTIEGAKHTVGFWLPVLNAFYESQIALTPELKNAYFSLATDEDDSVEVDEGMHLNSIRELLHELADLSVFDVAENFFAQSYAMPPDFFADLVLDLYQIEEGAEVALLTLLHPNEEVREVVVHTLDSIMHEIVLSSISLSRLQAIMHWYPVRFHAQFSRWIKTQRKKGIVFMQDKPLPILRIKASEVDGSGSQGIFVHVREKKTHRLCGVLLKYQFGMKDAWITPLIPAADVARYYDEAFDESVTLRTVDLAYLELMTQHFLAETINKGRIPDLHLLEMQELLGLHFRPKSIDLDYMYTTMAVKISPFTEQALEASLKRSKNWINNKRFTDSWFLENPHIDKLVNRCSNFVEGIKVCRFEEAVDAVFAEEMEVHREKWAFHFLWIALWAGSLAKKNEKLAEDSFFIAHAIREGRPLKSIPIMEDICRQSVMNSVETMLERGTHIG